MVPPLLSSISQGGFTGKKNYFGHFTAIAFSYIRTTFGASRSMRVGVRLDKQLEVSDPCMFGLRKVPLFIYLKHTQYKLV